jgi:dTDP-4-dehydrorhamnose reductase
MVLLTGSKGMLGTEIEILLRIYKLPFCATDKEVDISDNNAVEAFCKEKKFDWIINCAAYTAVDSAEQNYESAAKANMLGPKHLALAAKKLDCNLIHISTDYVFDGTNTSDYIECDSCDPKTVYGRTKLAGEAAIIDNHQKYFIFRTSWLYGKYGNNFVYTILRLLMEKSTIKVVDDQTGSPTYAKDLANAILQIVLKNSNSYGVYHYSNRGRTDWYEFALAIYKLAIQHKVIPRHLQVFAQIDPITSSEYKALAKRPQNSYLSTKKFESIFQLSIPNWKESLERFLLEVKK